MAMMGLSTRKDHGAMGYVHGFTSSENELIEAGLDTYLVPGPNGVNEVIIRPIGPIHEVLDEAWEKLPGDEKNSAAAAFWPMFRPTLPYDNETALAAVSAKLNCCYKVAVLDIVRSMVVWLNFPLMLKDFFVMYPSPGLGANTSPSKAFGDINQAHDWSIAASLGSSQRWFDINIAGGAYGPPNDVPISAQGAYADLMSKFPPKTKPKVCQHVWINAGFTSIREVCKHCDIER